MFAMRTRSSGTSYRASICRETFDCFTWRETLDSRLRGNDDESSYASVILAKAGIQSFATNTNRRANGVRCENPNLRA